MHQRGEGEVVVRRRRRGGPFQRAAAPRVACHIAQLFAPAEAHVELHQRAENAQQDQERAGCRSDKPHLQRGIIEMAQATRHAHQAEHVQRHEGQVEAHHPEPERALAPERIELETECLGEPVVDAGEQAEEHAADNHIMEMRDQEQAVVQREVRWWHGEHHAGHAANDEGHHEGHRPQHRHIELHATAIHGEQPVEDLRSGGNGDDHGGDAEERIDAGARTHGEEVV